MDLLRELNPAILLISYQVSLYPKSHAMISCKIPDLSGIILQISWEFKVPRDPVEDFYSAISRAMRKPARLRQQIGNDSAPIKCNSISYKGHRAHTTSHSTHHTTTFMDFHRDSIKIATKEDNVFLDVWFYKPSETAPYPLVVAGHG